MTYLELAYESAHDLDRGKITLGEYEERIKPLCDEIKPWNGWISTSERLPKKCENVLLSTNGGLVEDGNRSQIRIMQKVRTRQNERNIIQGKANR